MKPEETAKRNMKYFATAIALLPSVFLVVLAAAAAAAVAFYSVGNKLF